VREERARLKAIEEARFAAESTELAQLVSAQQDTLEEWREEARGCTWGRGKGWEAGQGAGGGGIIHVSTCAE